jgi:hypothetical protein
MGAQASLPADSQQASWTEAGFFGNGQAGMPALPIALQTDFTIRSAGAGEIAFDKRFVPYGTRQLL